MPDAHSTACRCLLCNDVRAVYDEMNRRAGPVRVDIPWRTSIWRRILAALTFGAVR